MVKTPGIEMSFVATVSFTFPVKKWTIGRRRAYRDVHRLLP